MIINATIDDLLELDELAEKVILHMKENKIPQWDLSYPRYEHFEKDILNKALIVFKFEDKIVGCMAFMPENDPPYKTISSWKKEYSIVLHRVLIDPDAQNKGIATKLLNYIKVYARINGYESIKIDTHMENFKMRNFLKKHGFVEGDYIEVMDRIAYEFVLED